MSVSQMLLKHTIPVFEKCKAVDDPDSEAAVTGGV